MSHSAIISGAPALTRATALQSYGAHLNDMQAYDNLFAGRQNLPKAMPSTKVIKPARPGRQINKTGLRSHSSLLSDIGAYDRAVFADKAASVAVPVPNLSFGTKTDYEAASGPDSDSLFSFDSADTLPVYAKDACPSSAPVDTSSPAKSRSAWSFFHSKKPSSRPSSALAPVNTKAPQPHRAEVSEARRQAPTLAEVLERNAGMMALGVRGGGCH